MRDRPDADTLLAMVAETLRSTVIPALADAPAYQARIAAHLVDLVRRELAGADEADRVEHASLAALLQRDGDLPALNRAFADALRDGTLAIADPAVAAHLRTTARAKLAIDQPGWPREIA